MEASLLKLAEETKWKIRSVLYYEKRYSFDDILDMKEAGLVADATGGGLVIGPTHEEGGVKFLLRDDNGYSVIGELEGYEYVLNVATSFLLRNQFDKFNQPEIHKTGKFEEYPILENIRVIDARLPPGGLFKSKLLIWEHRGHQMIFNRYSSKIHLELLNQVNNNYTFNYRPEGIYRARHLDIIDVQKNELICTQPVYWKDEETLPEKTW